MGLNFYVRPLCQIVDFFLPYTAFGADLIWKSAPYEILANKSSNGDPSLTIQSLCHPILLFSRWGNYALGFLVLPVFVFAVAGDASNSGVREERYASV